MDFGLLVLRVALGLVISAHGAQKAFGWFGGGGIAGTNVMTTKLGFRPAPVWAGLVIAGELGGGLLMALGLLNPLGPLGVGAAMVVAIVTAHGAKGFFNSKGGYEYALTLLAGAVAAAFTGPGRYSLDAVLGSALPRNLAETAAALTVLAVAAGLATRQPAAPPKPSPASA